MILYVCDSAQNNRKCLCFRETVAVEKEVCEKPQIEAVDEDSKTSENGDAKLKENGDKAEDDSSKDGENGDSTGIY